MEIRYRDIILRDMIETDIKDEIRWNTVETAWMDWDGPDLQPDEPFNENNCRERCLKQLRMPKPDIRKGFEICTIDGRHIGTVSSYPTGMDFQHLSWAEAEKSGVYWCTLGLSICESSLWCCGLGTQALTAFCCYYLQQGISNLRLQTWSGNIRMVRCAEKIGFREINRFVGNRHIRGSIYDGLTFQLDLDKFNNYLKQNT